MTQVYTSLKSSRSLNDKSTRSLPDPMPKDNLNHYCDWGMERTCPPGKGKRLTKYERRAVLLLNSIWATTAFITYSSSFITTEPGYYNPSGRELVGEQGQAACDFLMLRNHLPTGWVASRCPELPGDCNLLEGLNRSQWEYVRKENSVGATFDLFDCPGPDDTSYHGKIVFAEIQTLFWLFFGIGVTICGAMSDKLGRKLTLEIGLFGCIVALIISAMAPGIEIWGLGRCLQGFFVGNAGMTGFVWCAESITKDNQGLMTWVPSLYFTTGGILTALIALLIPNWSRYLMFAAAILALPPFFYVRAVYQSPKWLAATGKAEELHHTLNCIADINGRTRIPPPELKVQQSEEEKPAALASGSQFAGLCSPLLRPRLIVVCLLWMSTSYSYYGLSMTAPKALGNHTLEWCLGFVVEIPGFILAQPIINGRAGRRSAAWALGLAGILLMIFSVQESSPRWVRTWISVMYYPARMIVSFVFAVIYPWSAELMPSTVRQSGMGLASLCARLGTMATPWLALVPTFSGRMLLVGGPCLFVSLLAIAVLPETRGKPLPGDISSLESSSEETSQSSSESSDDDTVI